MQERGFSLIELLTVVSLIMIFMVFMLTRTPNLNGVARLETSVGTLLSAFRQARHDSISVAKLGASNEFPSYGVYVQENGTTVTIYADCQADDTGDATPTVDENDTFHFEDNNCGATYTPLPLEPGVTVSDIGIRRTDAGAYTTTPVSLSVQFVRPHPIVMMVTKVGTVFTVQPNAEAYIELRESRTNTTRRIRVNTNGLMFAE
jgi:Tfp pilus assembly protein FimT